MGRIRRGNSGIVLSSYYYTVELLKSWGRGKKAILTDYIKAAMHRARYKILPDDGTFYGEIPEFNGVYANADTLETCREELEEVLEEWILLRVSRNLSLPIVDGTDLWIKVFA